MITKVRRMCPVPEWGFHILILQKTLRTWIKLWVFTAVLRNLFLFYFNTMLCSSLWQISIFRPFTQKITYFSRKLVCKILGSHGDEYENGCLLGCCTFGSIYLNLIINILCYTWIKAYLISKNDAVIRQLFIYL
jgi:hypothetical protein